MIESLDSIFSAISPYLCVFALAGLILFAMQWRKQSGAIRGLVLGTILAIIWRLIYTLASSRYAMILVLPAVALGCYAVWNLEMFFPKADKKLVKYLQLVLLVALPLGLLAKSWNFSSYENSLKELAEVAKNDAKNYPEASFSGINIHDERFGYYSGIRNAKQIPVLKTADIEKLKHLFFIVDSNEVRYIIAKIKIHEENNLLQELGQYPGKLTKLGERFVNHKKRGKYILFRYCNPTIADAMTATASSPSPAENNLYENGDFEKIKPLPDSMREFGLERKISFFNRSDIAIPDKVEIAWLGGYNRLGYPEIEAVKSNAVAGKYSLRAKGDSRFAIVHAVPPGDYKFSLQLKALEDSVFNIHIYHFDSGMTENRIIATRKVFKSDTIWRYELPIPQSVLAPCRHFWVVISLNKGEILFDNISLQKMQP